MIGSDSSRTLSRGAELRQSRDREGAGGKDAREIPLPHGRGSAPDALDGDRPSSTLNFHPQMGYRRLGRTGLMISEIALGGHGGESVEERAVVLGRAAELGLNYLDNPTAEECDLYGEALGRNRQRWIIGFASWPEKLTANYEAQLTPALMLANIEARLKGYHTDMLDLWRPVAASWGNGQARPETLGDVSDRTLDMVVAVFERARKQGKVRFLGISGHKPALFRRVLDEYPQFSVLLFPYLFCARPRGQASLLTLAEEHDVGVIGTKPFAAGAAFGDKPAALGGRVDARAASLLKVMLQERRLSAIIPGILCPEQLERNVQASYTRHQPPADADQTAYRACMETYSRQLEGSYAGYGWLREWKTM